LTVIARSRQAEAPWHGQEHLATLPGSQPSFRRNVPSSSR
jgi:hypothetical protein